MAAHSPIRRPRPLIAPKRLSAVRLSTDSTGSLPAYSSPLSSRPTSQSHWPTKNPSPPLDKPPDYPQSAEEADQEDDFVPLRGTRFTATRRLRHRRGESYPAPASHSVDDLLERSVVALELSTNALLQSMDNQSRVSAIAHDDVFERSLARQTKMLDLRIQGTQATHDGWMDDLDDMMERVNGLFGEPAECDIGMSRSLPTGNSYLPSRRHHRSHLRKSTSQSGYLHISTSEVDVRDSLRPPRPLTQYVSIESTSGEASEATADLKSIYMPSTTGLRSAAQIRSLTGTDTVPHGLRKSVSSPGPNLHSTSPTSAYNMLSHLASNHSSPPGTATLASQSSPSISDSTVSRTIRRHSAGSFDSAFTFPSGLRRSRSTSRGRSSVSNDSQTSPLPSVMRAMTPPMEELTPSSSSDSFSSNHNVHAFRAMQSLRKILDQAPDPKGKRPAVRKRSPRPIFKPRTPPVAPSFGTSTATASVSRLFTRSSHHAHHSKPKQSSLKSPNSQPVTPTPETPGALTPASRLSSVPGTPRQVSFADLPEAYSGRKRKGKDRGNEKGKKGKDREDGGWWSGWFANAGGSAALRYDDRMEDRAMRGWGRPGAGGGGGGVTDEWML